MVVSVVQVDARAFAYARSGPGASVRLPDADAHAVGRHLALDLDQAEHAARHARRHLEQLARHGRPGELERAERRQPESAGRHGNAARTRCQAAGLSHHLDEDDGGHDRHPREVTLEEEVVRASDARRPGALAGNQLDQRVHEAHRRLVRQRLQHPRQIGGRRLAGAHRAAPGSSDTLTSSLPMFAPLKSRLTATGACSSPSTMSALYFSRPSAIHCFSGPNASW